MTTAPPQSTCGGAVSFLAYEPDPRFGGGGSSGSSMPGLVPSSLDCFLGGGITCFFGEGGSSSSAAFFEAPESVPFLASFGRSISPGGAPLDSRFPSDLRWGSAEGEDFGGSGNVKSSFDGTGSGTVLVLDRRASGANGSCSVGSGCFVRGGSSTNAGRGRGAPSRGRVGGALTGGLTGVAAAAGSGILLA